MPCGRGVSSICLGCRTLLRAGEACDAAHRVVSLADPAGRKRLADTVWAAVRGGREDAAPQDEWAGSGIVGLILSAVSAMTRPPPGSQTPVAAQWTMPAPPMSGEGAAVLAGIVEGRALLTGPASGAPCVAFSLELINDVAMFGRVVLRIAETCPFTMTLGGGERVLVDGGRVWMEAIKDCFANRDRIEAFVGTRVPGAALEHERRALFPFTDVRETLVRPGDRVEVTGTFEARPAPEDLRPEDPAYRGTPPSVLASRGAVWLRPLAR
jgi:hypothetical protein